MPLFIKGERVEKTPRIDRFVEIYAHFKELSQKLLTQEVREVGPIGLLYIGQREVAATNPGDDSVCILGSEDATTCHIAVLRHTGSGATSMIHFDGSSVSEGLDTMISLVKEQTDHFASGRLEIHLVGGFIDPRKNSHEVSDQILEALCNNDHDLYLVTACITHFNTVYKKNDVAFPVIYGIGCNVRTGEIFPAKFPDKGPDLTLRNARHFAGKAENIVIYDHKSSQMTIGPFGYSVMQDIDLLLTLPKPLIRKYLSTSPEQEPVGFEDSVRESLLQLKNWPDPMTSVFTDGQARRYVKDKDTGAWLKTK